MSHPILAPDRHPHCKEKFYAYMKCEADHPVANLWGACKQQLHDLKQCCKEEKALKREANIEKAKKDRERLMDKMKRRQEKMINRVPGYGVGPPNDDSLTQ